MLVGDLGRDYKSYAEIYGMFHSGERLPIRVRVSAERSDVIAKCCRGMNPRRWLTAVPCNLDAAAASEAK